MTRQEDLGQRTGVPVWLLGLLVLTVVASFSLSMEGRLVPLGYVDGAADGVEWFDLGENLATFGVIGSVDQPWVHRPPGYPLWVAAILRLTVDPRTHLDAAVNLRGLIALRVADSLLLGLSSLLLFLWLSRRLRKFSAFAAALLLGTNAYSLVMATLVHYDMLQWSLLLALILLLDAAFHRNGAGALGPFLMAGAFLGVVTLVRPVTLLAPIGLFPAFLGRPSPRRSPWPFVLLVAGMLAAIAPWTLRNLTLTHRFIPINVQGWTAVFASTSEVAQHNPDRYEWGLLTLRHYLPIYQRVTGEAEYKFETYAKNVLPLEDAARTAAIKNILSKPQVYLANVVKAATSLNTDVNALILTTFTRLQTGEPFNRRWILIGVRKAMSRGPEGVAFQTLHDLLLCAAVFGLGLAVLRKDRFLLPAFGLWAAIVATHALSYLDFFYYSVKMPFLIAFAFYGLDALPRAPRAALIVALSGLSLGLSWSMRLLG